MGNLLLHQSLRPQRHRNTTARRSRGQSQPGQTSPNPYPCSCDARYSGSSAVSCIGGVVLVAMAVLLTGCDPPYLADTYATSTPKPTSLDASEINRMPVAVLGFVAPGNLEGFRPTLSQALSGALSEVTPPIREISTGE